MHPPNINAVHPAPLLLPFQMLGTASVQEALTSEDSLALLIAALCHDLGHDGFSNSYHGAHHAAAPTALLLGHSHIWPSAGALSYPALY